MDKHSAYKDKSEKHLSSRKNAPSNASKASKASKGNTNIGAKSEKMGSSQKSVGSYKQSEKKQVENSSKRTEQSKGAMSVKQKSEQSKKGGDSHKSIPSKPQEAKGIASILIFR